VDPVPLRYSHLSFGYFHVTHPLRDSTPLRL
jgi:hypothetical protein